MHYFKNRHYTQRDYECTNVVACKSEKDVPPNDNYIPIAATDAILNTVNPLHSENGYHYLGYL